MGNESASVLWVNGRFHEEEEPVVSALDRGFTLGDGAFETMRASRGRAFRLGAHLARLRRGAEVLRLPPPDEGELVGAIQEVLSRAGFEQAVVRLTVTRGVDRGRGIGLPADARPTVAVRAMPSQTPSEEAFARGLRLAVSSVRRNESSPLSRIKSCSYGDAIVARQQARERGYDDALLLNTRGEVACATTANVFAVMGGRVVTPPTESGVLEGVTRGCVLEAAGSRGVEAGEGAFGLEALRAAEEVFVTNTALGLMPVTAVEGRAVGTGRPGPTTRRLRAAYEGIVAAELAGQAR